MPVSLRYRKLAMGNLRAFLSVAKHLNFRLAADELAVTQSAVSRQIKALEDEIGASLFIRHTRSVELSADGVELLQAAQPSVERIDQSVQQIRGRIQALRGRKSVAVTTFASFASMWLIPRIEEFQKKHPEIDLKIEATDALVDLDQSEMDVALRYARPAGLPGHAIRLFGEQLTPVCSPEYLRGQGGNLRHPKDLAKLTLIEDSSLGPQSAKWLTWRSWLIAQGQANLEPRRWLQFDYAYQIIQAALAGQGVALARICLVADFLASGRLVAPFPELKTQTPTEYWLIENANRRENPELRAFSEWAQSVAAHTRTLIDEPSS